MSESPTAAIQEFVSLAMLRRSGDLPLDARWRLDTLEDVIRDVIEGARPAPRKIANPSAKAAPARPKLNVEPAKVVVTKNPNSAPKFGPSSGAAATPPPPKDRIEEPVILSAADSKKVQEVDDAELPPSGYTASVKPCFLEDYYTADLTLVAGGSIGEIARVRAAGAESVALTGEARTFFGAGHATDVAPPVELTELPAATPAPEPVPVPVTPVAAPTPQPTATPARNPSGPPAPRAASVTPNARRAPPRRASGATGGPTAVVHLLAGGFKRGHLSAFDPDSGFVVIQGRGESAPEQIPLNSVLAVFFNLVAGTPGTQATGQKLSVKLANDRDLVGASPDYAPGVQAMTLVPTARRGNVDRIWVPAWSVKEIHFVN